MSALLLTCSSQFQLQFNLQLSRGFLYDSQGMFKRSSKPRFSIAIGWLIKINVKCVVGSSRIGSPRIETRPRVLCSSQNFDFWLDFSEMSERCGGKDQIGWDPAGSAFSLMNLWNPLPLDLPMKMIDQSLKWQKSCDRKDRSGLDPKGSP